MSLFWQYHLLDLFHNKRGISKNSESRSTQGKNYIIMDIDGTVTTMMNVDNDTNNDDDPNNKNSNNEEDELLSFMMIKKLHIPDVIVHPLVLLSVADHYHRVARGTRKRVIGILLGQSLPGGTMDITNSFALPFEEDSKNPVRYSYVVVVCVCALFLFFGVLL